MSEITEQSADARSDSEDTATSADPIDESVPNSVAEAADLSSDSTHVSPESIVEALLMSTDTPLAGSKIAQLLGVGDGNDIKRHVESLNKRYEAGGASFRIQLIAKGYQVLTQPAFDTWVRKLHKARAESRLSKAALETLAIVAYKQPILRADVEAIRGVAVGDMLVRLREMNLVRIAGRAEEIGRPLLYGTTKKFLDVFGLATLNDLPKLDDDGGSQTIPKLVLPDTGGSEPESTPVESPTPTPENTTEPAESAD